MKAPNRLLTRNEAKQVLNLRKEREEEEEEQERLKYILLRCCDVSPFAKGL